MSDNAKQPKSIKQKMAQLDEAVAWFQGDEFELEKALERYHEVEKLADGIEKDLTSLKNDIQVIAKRFDTDQA